MSDDELCIIHYTDGVEEERIYKCFVRRIDSGKVVRCIVEEGRISILGQSNIGDGVPVDRRRDTAPTDAPTPSSNTSSSLRLGRRTPVQTLARKNPQTKTTTGRCDDLAEKGSVEGRNGCGREGVGVKSLSI